MQMVSGLFYPLCGCRPLAKAIHPSASASGLFPLWLRAPRFVCAALSSHSRLLARARGGSCLGEGGVPSPSSGSSSFLRSPPFAQPPSSISFVSGWCRFRFLTQCQYSSEALVQAQWTLLAETAPRLNANACPECREYTALLPPVRAREDSLVRFLNTRHLFLFCQLV